MGPCIHLVCETINLQETSWPGQKRVLLGALLPRWVRLGQGALKRYLGADVRVNWPRSLTRAPNISDWDQNIVFLSDVWYDPNGSVHIHWHHWHQVLWKASMAVTTCRNHVACSGLQVVPPSLGSGAAFGSQSFCGDSPGDSPARLSESSVAFLWDIVWYCLLIVGYVCYVYFDV